jgi:hypothetical protein
VPSTVAIYRVADTAALTLEPTGLKRFESTLKRLANAMPGYQFFLEHSHLLQLVRKVSLRGETCRLPCPDRHGTEWRFENIASGRCKRSRNREAEALFIRLADWCNKHNAKLLVTTNWPVDQNYSPIPMNNPNRAFPRSKPPNFFRDRGIEFFDAGPAIGRQIGNQLDNYQIKDDGHPTEAGAKLIADTIWPWLEPRLRDYLVEEARLTATRLPELLVAHRHQVGMTLVNRHSIQLTFDE